MNRAAYLHLAWKEYRAIRAFWLSMIVLVVVVQGLSVATSHGAAIDAVFGLAIGAPAFFALGCAGAAFAVEQEEGTFDFLRAAPISPRQVFVTKLALVVVATLALFVVLWPLAYLIAGRVLPSAELLRAMLAMWAMAAVEAIAWGTLFSLLSPRPLIAVFLALFTSTTIVHLLAWGVARGRAHEFDHSASLALGPYVAAISWRALVAAGVLAIDVYLGLRWLHATPAAAGRERSAADRRGAETAEPRADAVEAIRAAADGWATKPDRGAMLGHLFWQQWRQSGRLMLLMAGAYVVATLLIVYSGLAGSDDASVLPMFILAALMGCCVFHADQEQGRHRFFVEHNVPPRYVWLTRQLPWMATMTIATLVIGAAWLHHSVSFQVLWDTVWSMANIDVYQARHLSRYPMQLIQTPPVLVGLIWVVVAYCVGQWVSMLVRSGIMAGFFALVATLPLCFWVLAMTFLRVNRLWSVMPIPLVLLWATWLRAPDWARETTRWSARLRAAAAVLVPAATLIASVAIYRWQQIPPSSPDVDTQAYLSRITPESKATADMYRAAGDGLLGGNSVYLREPSAGDESARVPTARELSWLRENAEPLALALEASARPTCSFGGPETVMDAKSLFRYWRLELLIVLSGRQLEAEGKLDEALERYFAALRVVWQFTPWTNNRGIHLPQSGRRIFTEIVHWGCAKGQTPERIAGAIDKLRAIDSSVLGLDNILTGEYILYRRYAQGDRAAWEIIDGPGGSDIFFRTLLEYMPWERQRSVRLLDMLTATASRRLSEMRHRWAANMGLSAFLAPPNSMNRGDLFVTMHDSYEQGLQQKVAWLDSTFFHLAEIGRVGQDLADLLADFEASKRAAILRLAIVAYRREHGKLPDSLDEVVGPYLDALPSDPYSGRPFRYFPQGLNPATPEGDGEMAFGQSKARISETIDPTAPCIWCIGRNLWVFHWTDDRPSPVRVPGSDQLAEEPYDYYMARSGMNAGTPLPDLVARVSGEWFTIPDEQSSE